MTALETKNLNMFGRFTIGDKLLITDLETKKPILGVVHSFSYNSMEELCLVVNVFKTHHLVIHPYNACYRIETL